MSISKRMINAGLRDKPHPLAGWTQPGGAPLVVEPGETVMPSKAEGWVEISGKGRPRYARAEPVAVPTAQPTQLTMF